jgi:hypothetical protein
MYKRKFEVGFVTLAVVLGGVAAMFQQSLPSEKTVHTVAGQPDIIDKKTDLHGQRADPSALKTSVVLFEANHGQAPEGVDFLARIEGGNVMLTPNRFVWLFRCPDPSVHGGDSNTRIVHSFEMRFLDAKPVLPIATSGQEGVVNYLPGRGQTAILNTPRFASIGYKNIYKGIDLDVFGALGVGLEYDLHVSPGASVQPVRISFETVDAISLNPKGDLTIRVSGHTFNQQAPTLFQDIDGVRTLVSGKYALLNKEVRFSVAQYDRAKRLVIDPIVAFGAPLSSGATTK